MTPNQAFKATTGLEVEEGIREAIGAGYKLRHKHADETAHYADTLLDPIFWKSLGKAEGWDGPAPEGMTRFADIKDDLGNTQEYWLYLWHFFINCLAQEEA